MLKTQNPRARQREIERIHNATFHEWFENHVRAFRMNIFLQFFFFFYGLQVTFILSPQVMALKKANIEHISDELFWLAKGPNDMAIRYTAYLINGFRFHTKDRELNRNTQNSGVVVSATTSSFASAKDENPSLGDVNYYGILTDIFELDYRGHFRVVLFKCDWVDINRRSGIKQDEFGFTLVNFKRLTNTGKNFSDEPFVLASQAEQVFYVQDPIEKDWHVVVKHKPRDLFDMNEKLNLTDGKDDMDVDFLYSPNENLAENIISSDIDEDINWVRTDVPGVTIDVSLPTSNVAREGNDYDSDFIESDC